MKSSKSLFAPKPYTGGFTAESSSKKSRRQSDTQYLLEMTDADMGYT